MILSCYTLNLRHGEVRKCLSSAYEMHRTVMSIFPMTGANAPRKDMSILYRVVSDGLIIKLYIFSGETPIKSMPDGFCPVAGSPKDVSDVMDSLTVGRVLHFDIKTMPYKKVTTPGSKNSKRVYLIKEDEREAWLKRKALDNGFEVLTFIEESDASNKIKEGEYRSIVFKGLLRITDSEKLVNAYQNGIGAERAFGCGMLLLSQPQ